MSDKKLTDAELVEAAAREVLGANNLFVTCPDGLKRFDPFTDMNDLQMIKDKHPLYEEQSFHNGYRVTIPLEPLEVYSFNESLTRAWLEAALSAERGKG